MNNELLPLLPTDIQEAIDSCGIEVGMHHSLTARQPGIIQLMGRMSGSLIHLDRYCMGEFFDSAFAAWKETGVSVCSREGISLTECHTMQIGEHVVQLLVSRKNDGSMDVSPELVRLLLGADDAASLATAANVDECGASISVYRVRNWGRK